MHSSAIFLRDKGVGNIDLGIIAGSGLSPLHEILDTHLTMPYTEIPHMPVGRAPGHEGVLKYGSLGDAHVLMFCGRLHYYEGFDLWEVAYPVRIMQALGVSRVLTTAAVGGLASDLKAGDLVLITDHINLMPDNPLRGFDDPGLGERFPDLSLAYDPAFSQQLEEAAAVAKVPLRKGVYAGLQGPSLETQAECHFLRTVGADIVGMSVIPEVIVAAQAGIRMAALCSVSNMAWHPEHTQAATVEEILAAANASIPCLSAIIKACKLTN